jgi:hypothetical protein
MGLFSKLINGDTRLKSLRFGADNSFDKPGEGYSNQPYIVKPIPDGQSPDIGIDYILKGGVLAASRTLDDVSRLTKMFEDTKSPAGLLFIGKQQLLSLSGVRTQASNLPFGLLGYTLLNDGIYSPLNTLAQAGVSAVGGHLNKQGILGGIESTFGLGQGYSANLSSISGIDSNRLVGLYLGKISNAVPSPNLPFSFTTGGNSIASDPNYILSYVGGPDSILGVGRTRIKFASNRIILNGSNLKGLRTYDMTNSTFSTLSISQIQSSGDNINVNRGQASYIPKIQDFRTQLRSPGERSSIISDTFSYNDANNQTIEGRVHLGNPGRRGNIASYVDGKRDTTTNLLLGATDKITAKQLYSSRLVDPVETNDLVKFRIEAINNDDPGNSVFIHFRAFLDSFSDAFSATWNSTKYIGRGEEFYTYGGFTRGININWTVAAQSKDELIPMHQKLNYLASNLTPDYSDGGYMRGPMMRLTVGGYLYSQPGFITSLTYTVDDASPWEIGINNISAKSDTNTLAGETAISDKSVKELPHIIRVVMAYTPIHEFVPRKQKNIYNPNSGEVAIWGPEHYIALSQGDHNNYDNDPKYIPKAEINIIEPIPIKPINNPLAAPQFIPITRR